MSKTLIIYFSRKGENYTDKGVTALEKGNTEYVAEFIREAVDADVFRVETVKEYSSGYLKCTEEAKEELKKNSRPELKRYLDSVADYDNIVVAGPCWWGDYPRAIFSQLDRLELKGKKVFPVMTHEGSGLGSAVKSLKKACKGAVIAPGLAIRGADAPDSRDAVMKWAAANIK